MAAKKTFEECLERLGEIVAQLESGQATLGESLKLYEEGSKLAASCGDMLEKAQLKIEQIDSQYRPEKTPETGREQ
ncbi:MAG: exodeoxyribonuclease VII small subunit [Oscillospiraceae bacterium]